MNASALLVSILSKSWPVTSKLIKPLIKQLAISFITKLKDEAARGKLHESLGEWSDEVELICDILTSVVNNTVPAEQPGPINIGA